MTHLQSSLTLFPSWSTSSAIDSKVTERRSCKSLHTLAQLNVILPLFDELMGEIYDVQRRIPQPLVCVNLQIYIQVCLDVSNSVLIYQVSIKYQQYLGCFLLAVPSPRRASYQDVT